MFVSFSAYAQTNKVLNLDGDGDYVSVADDPSLNFGASTDFSIEFWIKASIQDSELIGKAGGQVQSHIGWNIQCENTPAHGIGIRLDMSDGNNVGVHLITTGEEALDNNWHHVAFSIDRDRYAKVFLDGIEKDSENVSSIGNINNNEELRLGWRGDWFFFKGLVDEVRIWNIIRTQEQIQSTMYTTLIGNDPGLVAYWRFDEETGATTAYDSSLNSNEGLLFGDAAFVEIGDVNGDGDVDVKDATEILRHVVGLPPAEQFIEDCADVSKNGSITAYDASLVMQKVAGLIDEF